MSSDAKLPPYSEKPSALQEEPVPSPQTTTHARIAGNVQTCAIKDLQVDYLKIVRESVPSYSISLTVDLTPLYRVEFMEDRLKSLNQGRRHPDLLSLRHGTACHSCRTATTRDQEQERSNWYDLYFEATPARRALAASNNTERRDGP